MKKPKMPPLPEPTPAPLPPATPAQATAAMGAGSSSRGSFLGQPSPYYSPKNYGIMGSMARNLITGSRRAGRKSLLGE